MKLKTKKQILNNAKTNLRELVIKSNFSRIGIYFLIKENKIIYIGKSVYILDRLETHKRSRKRFNKIYVEHCDEKIIDKLEARYIYKFLPEENKHLNLNALRQKLS